MKKKVRVAALSVALLAVAVSAYRLWEIYAGYHQADQVYQDTAAQVIHTESAGAPEDAPTWPGEKPKRTAPISVDFAALQQENPGCGGMDLLPRYRDPIPSGSGGRQRTLPEPDDRWHL